jgi:hypothetical protein
MDRQIRDICGSYTGGEPVPEHGGRDITLGLARTYCSKCKPTPSVMTKNISTQIRAIILYPPITARRFRARNNAVAQGIVHSRALSNDSCDDIPYFQGNGAMRFFGEGNDQLSLIIDRDNHLRTLLYQLRAAWTLPFLSFPPQDAVLALCKAS